MNDTVWKSSDIYRLFFLYYLKTQPKLKSWMNDPILMILPRQQVWALSFDMVVHFNIFFSWVIFSAGFYTEVLSLTPSTLLPVFMLLKCSTRNPSNSPRTDFTSLLFQCHARMMQLARDINKRSCQVRLERLSEAEIRNWTIISHKPSSASSDRFVSRRTLMKKQISPKRTQLSSSDANGVNREQPREPAALNSRRKDQESTAEDQQQGSSDAENSQVKKIETGS